MCPIKQIIKYKPAYLAMIPIQTLLSQLIGMWATRLAHCSSGVPGIPFPHPWSFALSPPGVSCRFLSDFQTIQVPGFSHIFPIHLSLRFSFLPLSIYWICAMCRVTIRPWEHVSERIQCFHSRAYRLAGDPPKQTLQLVCLKNTALLKPTPVNQRDRVREHIFAIIELWWLLVFWFFLGILWENMFNLYNHSI